MRLARTDDQALSGDSGVGPRPSERGSGQEAEAALLNEMRRCRPTPPSGRAVGRSPLGVFQHRLGPWLRSELGNRPACAAESSPKGGAVSLVALALGTLIARRRGRRFPVC